MKAKKVKVYTSLSLCIISIILLILIISYGFQSYAWFAFNDNVSAEGLSIAIKDEDYDIYIDKTEKYNGLDNSGEEAYEGMSSFKAKLSERGMTFNDSNELVTTTSLALELDNELQFEGKYYLAPGSYGSFTFYIDKKVEGDITINLNLSLSGYKKGYDEDYVPYAYIPEGDTDFDNALNMLKGHILFFENRIDTNGKPSKYEGFIDETYTFSTSGKSPCSGGIYDGLYRVTLYWEWPLLYSDLIEGMSTQSEENKYPYQLETYIASHREYFFASYVNSTNNDELGDGYNDGDQLIGDNIHYLILRLE